jgi:hypothetical protein
MSHICAEPSGDGLRPIDVNRTRWALVAAAVTMVAVLTGVAVVVIRGAASGPSSPQGRQAFSFDAAYPDPDPLVLVVRYGDSSSCPSLAVRHAVTQTPDQVVVTLTREPMPADRPCTSDYGARLVRISLTDPLGSRRVVDGSRATPVPISTGRPPFG